MGFDLYLKLLDDAVQRLSDSGYEAEEDTYLELEYAGYIPDAYISLPTMKMEVYKKIASIMSQADLDTLYQELADRFGPLPEEVQSPALPRGDPRDLQEAVDSEPQGARRAASRWSSPR